MTLTLTAIMKAIPRSSSGKGDLSTVYIDTERNAAMRKSAALPRAGSMLVTIPSLSRPSTISRPLRQISVPTPRMIREQYERFQFRLTISLRGWKESRVQLSNWQPPRMRFLNVNGGYLRSLQFWLVALIGLCQLKSTYGDRHSEESVYILRRQCNDLNCSILNVDTEIMQEKLISREATAGLNSGLGREGRGNDEEGLDTAPSVRSLVASVRLLPPRTTGILIVD